MTSNSEELATLLATMLDSSIERAMLTSDDVPRIRVSKDFFNSIPYVLATSMTLVVDFGLQGLACYTRI